METCETVGKETKQPTKIKQTKTLLYLYSQNYSSWVLPEYISTAIKKWVPSMAQIKNTDLIPPCYWQMKKALPMWHFQITTTRHKHREAQNDQISSGNPGVSLWFSSVQPQLQQPLKVHFLRFWFGGQKRHLVLNELTSSTSISGKRPGRRN